MKAWAVDLHGECRQSKHLGGRPKDKCGPDSNFLAKVDYRVRCCVNQNQQTEKTRKQAATSNKNKTNLSPHPKKLPFC